MVRGATGPLSPERLSEGEGAERGEKAELWWWRFRGEVAWWNEHGSPPALSKNFFLRWFLEMFLSHVSFLTTTLFSLLNLFIWSIASFRVIVYSYFSNWFYHHPEARQLRFKQTSTTSLTFLAIHHGARQRVVERRLLGR